MEQESQQNQESPQGESVGVFQSETPAPAPASPPSSDQPPASDASPVSQLPPPPVLNENRVDFRFIALEARRKKHEVRLEKVVALVHQRGRITNNDIQKLLRVSDATATRYAKILISRNLLKKSGKTRGASYEPM